MADTLQTAFARFLAAEVSDNQKEFELGAQIAQIFSGCMFAALCMYLIFSNSTKLSYIQRAAIEKRLSVCCNINIVVAGFSAFFNFFQLTKVDDWALPGTRTFTVDTARPLEWILTCPLMQLSLVLMGGPRLPDWRRLAMPALSATTLAFGSLTLFFEQSYVIVSLYACGACTHSVAMFFNRQQIIEHTKGTEGLFQGDSEFRKATLLLMLTWLPFPIWFALSPEGLNIVSNIGVVQMGWSFLNIVSKFSLICYLQRIKDNHANRLKVKRAVQQTISKYNFPGMSPSARTNSADIHSGDLGGCVIETMQFLGMPEVAERFLMLLKEAQITSLEQLSQLTKQDCENLQLPYDTILSIQKRQRVWAIEIVDDAETGIEVAEKYYNISSKQNQLFNLPCSPGSDCNGSRRQSSMTNELNEDTNGNFNGKAVVCSDYPVALNGNNFYYGNTLKPPGHPDSKPYVCKEGNKEFDSIDDKLASQSDMILESTKKMLEQFESNLLEKIDYALSNFAGTIVKVGKAVDGCRDSVDHGLQEVSKQMERSQARLEAKMEYAFSATENKQCASISNTMKEHLNEMTRKGRRVCSPTRSEEEFVPSRLPTMQSFDNVEKALQQIALQLQQVREAQDSVVGRFSAELTSSSDGLTQRLTQEWKATAFTLESKMAMIEEVQTRHFAETVREAQDSVVGRFSAELTSASDGLTQRLTQEWKATAFTLQSKMAMIEEVQTRNFAETEERLSSKMQQLVAVSTDDFKVCVTKETQNSLVTIQQKMESLKTSRSGSDGSLERKIADLMKDVSKENSKQVEMGLGMLGNALRVQLDTMQAAQSVLRRESDAALNSKLDTVLDQMKDQMKRNSEKIQNFDATLSCLARSGTNLTSTALKPGDGRGWR